MIVLDAVGESYRDFDGGVSAVVATGLRVGMVSAGVVGSVKPMDFHRTRGGNAWNGADLALLGFRRCAT
jgi:hypothetical protein